MIDILVEKWSAFSSFQRARGVLRLLANVVEDLYQRETNIDVILPGDINMKFTLEIDVTSDEGVPGRRWRTKSRRPSARLGLI